MAALSIERQTPRRDGVNYARPVAASVKIYEGAIVMLDSSGNAKPGATATGQVADGVAQGTADNSTGLAGAKTVTVEKGVFRFANSAAADLISAAEIGDNCYIVDDQTVAKTDGTGTRSVAGKIEDVETAGVWIRFS